MGEPIDRLETEQPRQPGKQPIDRMHEHVLPHQRRNRGHDKERGDDQKAHDALPEHWLIEQQRQKCAADKGDGQNATHKDQGV